jgi:hypothetical protein
MRLVSAMSGAVRIVCVAALAWLAVAALGLAPAFAQTDIPANTGTGATLAKLQTQASTIGFAGDVDWFRVTLRDSNAYKIAIGGPAVIRIYTQNGVETASSGTARSYVWRTPGTGIYFIAAKGIGSQTGSYTIKLALYDASANTATEARMIIGKPKLGTMKNTGNLDFLGDPDRYPPDEDWYILDLGTKCYRVAAGYPLAFSAYGNRQQQIWTKITSFNRDLAPWPESCEFTCDAAAGCSGGFNFLPPIAGRYYVKALAYPAGATVDGLRYTLTATEQPLDQCVQYNRLGPSPGPDIWGFLTKGGVGCCDPRDPYCRTRW